jgi:hypothetical protein
VAELPTLCQLSIVQVLAKTSDSISILLESPLVRHGAFLMSKLPTTYSYGTVMAFGLVFALLVGIYWQGLHGAFFFDDGPSILFAPGVQLDMLSWDALSKAWLSGGAGPTGRPIAQISFSLNYYFNGFSALAFKATNLVIHAVCGVLVFGVAKDILTVVNPDDSSERTLIVAGTVASTWLLHPIQLLPVLHVVQRMTSLSALFLLAAFYLHMRARSGHGWRAHTALATSWLVLWPLSFLSKETGVLFPAFALAWELLIRWHSTQRLDKFATIFIVTTLGLAGAAGIYLLNSASEWLWSGYDLRDFTLTERLYTEGRVVWFYVGLIMLPRLGAFGLYHDDMGVSTSLLSPWTTLPSLIGLVAVAAAIVLLRKRVPLMAFGLAWFLIGHSLESTVLPLEIAHEHRNYLPLFGLVLAATGGVFLVFEANARARVPVALFTGAALISCAGMTALRAYQFGEPVRRTQMEAQNHPASARTQYEAGATLLGLTASMPNTNTAVRQHFELANTADPHFKPAAFGLIQLNCQTVQSAGSSEVANLAQRLRNTPFAPGDRNVMYNLKEGMNAGALCLTRLEVDDLFSAALANPTVSTGVAAILHSWHADYLWLQQHDMAAARAALARSLKLNPTEISNKLKWAQLLFIAGEREAAGKALLTLRRENLSKDERITLDELMAAINIQSP